MINSLKHIVLSLCVLGFLAGCANSPFYHQNFMRGQVVSVSDSSAVVCIGSYKDELIGKTLNVYNIEYYVGTQEGDDGFRRDLVGAIKIDSIINEHFARATVISGPVAKNNMVELAR